MHCNPLVSIVIPVYNREDIIHVTLESAINQSYKNIEIIVVDNCSTDDTYFKVKEYSDKDQRIRLFKNYSNIGPVNNWKKCIEYSEGEFIKILWSDDQISFDFVERTIDVLKNNNEIAFVYTKTIICLSDGEKKEAYRFGETGKYLIKDFVISHLFGGKPVPVSPGNAMFRTKDVEKNLIISLENPKDLDFSRFGAGNDLLLFLMTCNNYKYFFFIDESLSCFRTYKNSFTTNYDLDEFYTYSKIYFLSLTPQYKMQKKAYYAKLFYFRKKYRYMVEDKLGNRYLCLFFLIIYKIVQKLRRLI